MKDGAQATQRLRPSRQRERGFTLIEALIAVIVLVFGLVAVAQLLTVAASSNSNANGSTVAAAAASQELERLQTVPFNSLPACGALPAVADGVNGCGGGCFSDRQIAGGGTVRTCWSIQTPTGAPNTNMRFITVRAQVLGPFSALTRAEFRTLRTRNGGPPTPTPTPAVGP